MKYPKLKNALLCRILVYVVIIGVALLPTVIVLLIKPIPDSIKVVTFLASCVGLLAYLFKNFILLMGLDMELACIHCHNNARTKFSLKKRFSKEKAKKKIKRFGKEYAPVSLSPKPEILRYKFSSPVTVYTRGIEKVLLSYDVDYLDKSLYDMICSSAYTNSKSLIGKKKAVFLDREQKKSPLNRATVVFIFAKRVDEKLRCDLHKIVSKQNKDGDTVSFLPCVIDLEKGECTFNSLCDPYLGFGYPITNRGVRLIKRIIFNGKLPLSKNENRLDPLKDIDLEESLWHHWAQLGGLLKEENKKDKKIFQAMSHGEIIKKDDSIYVKWNDRGVWLCFEIYEETKTVKIDSDNYWYYPKSNPIGKKTLTQIREVICNYFADLGYTAEFVSFDD